MDQASNKKITYTDFVDFSDLDDDDEQFMVEIENIITETLPEIVNVNTIQNLAPTGVDENDYPLVNSLKSNKFAINGFNTEVAESVANIAPVKNLNLQANADLPFKFFDIDGNFF
jgi:hypothetical protein